MSDEDRAVAAEHGGDGFEETARDGSPYRLRLVAHDPNAYDWYYNVVANPTLWFLQHYMWGLPYAPDLDLGLHNAWFGGYLPVNETFAAAVVAEIEREPDAAVFLHDYHLYLAPKLIRERRPDAVHVALHPHPVAAVRLLARPSGAPAALGARGAARERHRRLPHRPLEAELPAHVRGDPRRRGRRPRRDGDARRAPHRRHQPSDRDRPVRVRRAEGQSGRARGGTADRGGAQGVPRPARRPHRSVEERHPRLPRLRAVPRPAPRSARPCRAAHAARPVAPGHSRVFGVPRRDPARGADGERPLPDARDGRRSTSGSPTTSRSRWRRTSSTTSCS